MDIINNILLQKKIEVRGWELFKQLIDDAKLNREDKRAIKTVLNPAYLTDLAED